MSRFKDLMAEDVHRVFLNLNEFAELHNINGKEMSAIIEHAEARKREKRYKDHIDGMYQGLVVLYVAASDYGSLPPEGSYVVLDGAKYTVSDADSQDGMYVLTLAANRGRGR